MRLPVIFLSCFLSGVYCLSASASIVLNTTRVVYPQSEKEVTVKADNNSKYPVLIQNWIDTGDASASPDTIKSPFLLTPPMNRVDPGKGQTLRIIYTGHNEVKDKETLFYLNVLEIPPVKTDTTNPNRIQIAFRTRIKMFLRPEGLQPDPVAAAESIKWLATNGKLQAVNHTPYYITIPQVQVSHGSQKGTSPAGMIAPGGSIDIHFSSPGMAVSVGDRVQYQYINDWGAVKPVNAVVQ